VFVYGLLYFYFAGGERRRNYDAIKSKSKEGHVHYNLKLNCLFVDRLYSYCTIIYTEQMSLTDKALGFLLLTISLVVFVYYSVWILLLVIQSHIIAIFID
jgi:hypothetical protein